jgi:hypothetical protein
VLYFLPYCFLILQGLFLHKHNCSVTFDVLNILFCGVFIYSEVKMLVKVDEHENVVKYYTQESDMNFIYIGLQLCDMSLK